MKSETEIFKAFEDTIARMTDESGDYFILAHKFLRERRQLAQDYLAAIDPKDKEQLRGLLKIYNENIKMIFAL